VSRPSIQCALLVAILLAVVLTTGCRKVVDRDMVGHWVGQSSWGGASLDLMADHRMKQIVKEKQGKPAAIQGKWELRDGNFIILTPCLDAYRESHGHTAAFCSLTTTWVFNWYVELPMDPPHGNYYHKQGRVR
jgi:hypothetical protein